MWTRRQHAHAVVAEGIAAEIEISEPVCSGIDWTWRTVEDDLESRGSKIVVRQIQNWNAEETKSSAHPVQPCDPDLVP